MKNIEIDLKHVHSFIDDGKFERITEELTLANKQLHDKTGKGNDFLGWIELPSSTSADFLKDINQTVEKLKQSVDYLIVVGIGGSYLGAKAIIEALSGYFAQKNVIFAGFNLSEDYLSELIRYIDDKNYGICVISKSGTTTEPAVAFRVLREHLEQKIGKQKAQERIIAITDKEKGALKRLADQQGYKTYIIPDDIGGRYSVLTSVGLVPVAFAGFNIEELIAGAAQMEKQTSYKIDYTYNIAEQYAAARYLLYKNNYSIEIQVNYEPRLHYFTEWWKQLYGESEGKDHKGIFPVGVDFTTDLHSLGQYIQEGKRNLFETVLSVQNTLHELKIPYDDENSDKLNYIAGNRISYVNKMAEKGTMMAHVDGGVPNILIEIPAIDEYYLGELIYFFEKACGISGYMLGVNPFDQPGVEAYKRNMFALLGKEGFEKEREFLKARLKI